MTITHKEAKNIVARAMPHLTAKESLMLRAISNTESQYGNWWRQSGVGSHNWGAITAGPKWTGPIFEHPDHYVDEKGTKIDYVTKFRVYPTPEDGAIDLFQVAFKPNVKVATTLGHVEGVSRAMKDNNYYGGNKITGEMREALIRSHAKKLQDGINAIRKSTGEPDPFVLTPTPPTKPPGFDLATKAIVYSGIVVFLVLLYGANKGGQIGDKQ